MTDYLQFAEQQTLNFFLAVLPLQLQKDEKKKITAKAVAYAGFSKRGGGRKFENIENNEEQNENFPPQNQVCFPAQN